MPRKNELKASPKVMEKAAKRHLAGEQAEGLAKEHKVSRATIFNWTARYKEQALEQSRREGINPKELEKQDKATLIARLQAVELENRRLKDKVVALMLKAGEI
jgi:transposase